MELREQPRQQRRAETPRQICGSRRAWAGFDTNIILLYYYTTIPLSAASLMVDEGVNRVWAGCGQGVNEVWTGCEQCGLFVWKAPVFAWRHFQTRRQADGECDTTIILICYDTTTILR